MNVQLSLIQKFMFSEFEATFIVQMVWFGFFV